MLMTDRAKSALTYGRWARRHKAAGFIKLDEHGDPLWKFHRGAWFDRRIDQVKIAPNGIELWIKVSAPLDGCVSPFDPATK